MLLEILIKVADRKTICLASMILCMWREWWIFRRNYFKITHGKRTSTLKYCRKFFNWRENSWILSPKFRSICLFNKGTIVSSATEGLKWTCFAGAKNLLKTHSVVSGGCLQNNGQQVRNWWIPIFQLPPPGNAGPSNSETQKWGTLERCLLLLQKSKSWSFLRNLRWGVREKG